MTQSTGWVPWRQQHSQNDWLCLRVYSISGCSWRCVRSSASVKRATLPSRQRSLPTCSARRWELKHYLSSTSLYPSAGLNNSSSSLSSVIRHNQPSERSELAEIMLSSQIVCLCVCLSVTVCVLSIPVCQTVGELNADSSKMVKAADFKFDVPRGQSGYDALNIFRKGSIVRFTWPPKFLKMDFFVAFCSTDAAMIQSVDYDACIGMSHRVINCDVMWCDLTMMIMMRRKVMFARSYS